MFKTSIYIAILAIVLCTCRKPNENDHGYLSLYTGTYEGIMHRWTANLTDTGFVKYVRDYDMAVTVARGDKDSTLTFFLSYGKNGHDIKKNVPTSVYGNGLKCGGSRDGCTRAYFKNDSLNLSYIIWYGMGYKEGFNFHISKK